MKITSVFVVLAEGFEEIEAIVPIDILRRAGLNVTTVGLGKRIVTGSHGITIMADLSWEVDAVSDQTPDALILPGGMPGSKNLGDHAGLKQMAQRVASQGGILAAICAAPALTLASWGLLANHRATCYPGCESLFSGDVTYCPEPVVVDKSIITAAGAGVAAPFAFKIAEIMTNREKIDELRKQMLFAS